MKNLFPKAEKITIEEILGVKRINAHAPTDQIPVESNLREKSIESTPFLKIREDFDQNKDEKTDIKIRNFLIEFYLKNKRQVFVQESYAFYRKEEKVSFRDFLKAFDYCEDNCLINYKLNLKAHLEKLQNLVENKSTEKKEVKNECTDEKYKITNLKHSVKKYFDKNIFLNTFCKCKEHSHFFTSDLFFICESCLEKEDFPSKYTLRNFHRISDFLFSSIWSKKEEYFLLKGVEKFLDDWNAVCEFVNEESGNKKIKKSRDHCIFHFICLCILENIENYNSLPFSQFPNQISTFVAFIGSYLDPSICSFLSKKFLQIMNEFSSQKEIMEVLLKSCVEASKFIVKNEEEKLKRLKEVRIEAIVKKIEMKIKVIKKMEDEKMSVKKELLERRQNLMEEIYNNK